MEPIPRITIFDERSKDTIYTKLILTNTLDTVEVKNSFEHITKLSIGTYM